MKIVIDPGSLSKPAFSKKVQRFLTVAPDNIVILTDFALGEACNGANAVGLKRTFSALREYPAQINVLKITPVIAKMTPSASWTHERFVDDAGSNQLRAFLHRLFSDAHTIDLEIAARANHAQQVFESLLQASEYIRADMQNQLKRFTPQQLSHLRKGRLTAETAQGLMDNVREVAQELFLDYADFTDLPPANDAIYSFPLRFSLAICVLVLHWGMDGGVQARDRKNLRNDITDMTYVAYATFYDDLVTADKRTGLVYKRTRQLLPELFGVQGN